MRYPIGRVQLCSLLVAAVAGSVSAEESPARSLLERSLAFHDGAGVWRAGAWRLVIEESRPDDSVRRTEVVIDGASDSFAWSSTRQGREMAGSLLDGGCTLSVEGREADAEELETLGLDCERLGWLRDYYSYLWGLPMKLLDPGTIVDPEVGRTSFLGRGVDSIRVSYEEGVGSDVWYFYFDPGNAALVGYRFYHDESAGDGEYIRLDGLFGDGGSAAGGVRLPAERTWYTNAGDELLGTDRLVSLERLR